MKIAIIGTGIAGNVVAHKLHDHAEITVFEANDYIGGHTHTHQIELDNEQHNIDTGFIVFNHWTYPNFIRLLKELNVEIQESDMSFSVKCEKTGLEYNGTNLNTLFAQRTNLVRPSFHRMLRDILRFNEQSKTLLAHNPGNITLGQYLLENRYSNEFITNYIIPMGSAIWSTPPQQMMEFPAYFFIRFFNNHGMLNVNDRPTWYVIKGGSFNYVEQLTKPFRDRIHLNSAIEWIKRRDGRVHIKPTGSEPLVFDYAFLACHSDQALKLLHDPSADETRVLGAIPYQKNEAVLHTDESVLPKKRLAWAAWNYHILEGSRDRVALTYNMNILQNIKSRNTFCVTLNHTDAIKPSKIIKRIQYDHPLFTLNGMNAQARQELINGPYNTYFCGAYWRNGFHEDGVVSALNAIEHFKRNISNEKLHIYRAS